MKHIKQFEDSKNSYFIIIKTNGLDTLFVMEVFKEYKNYNNEDSIDTIQRYHYIDG